MQEIKKEIDGIIKKAQEEAQGLRDEFNTLNTVDTSVYVENGDQKAYLKATEHNTYVASRKAFIKNRLDELENGKIADAGKLKDAIYKNQRAIKTRTDAAITEKLKEIKNLCLIADQEINRGNALIKTIAKQIERPRTRTSLGGSIPATIPTTYHGNYSNMLEELEKMRFTHGITPKIVTYL